MTYDPRLTTTQRRSFYRAIVEAEAAINARKPNLIIGPLRGAKPLIESIGVIASLEGREMPQVLYVETGCIDRIVVGVNRESPRPLTAEQKLNLVAMRLYHVMPDPADRLDICIVDEVHTGGSIVKNFDLVNAALRINYPKNQFSLSAIGICDEERKCGRFLQMVMLGLVTPFYVEKLFTIDRSPYLTPLARIGDNVVETGAYNRDWRPELYAEIAAIHRGNLDP